MPGANGLDRGDLADIADSELMSEVVAIEFRNDAGRP
jgi:hypothetical protein